MARESAESIDPLVGVKTTWIVGDELARGGTAILFAVTASDGTAGVCKLPSGHRFAVTKEMRDRYQRELLLLSRIDHPKVLKMLDLVEVNGEKVGIFERAQQSIYQLLPTDGRPKTADSLRWLADAAEGVAALSAQGIVHRDITPKNLLVMKDGRVCVADLGAARKVDDDSVTLLGEHLGSLVYASERQAREPHAADFSDDVFSLGQVAYQLLTGRRPIGNPPPLDTVRPDLPAELAEAVSLLRHPDRRRRPRDGDALVQLLALDVGRTRRVALGLAEERFFEEAIDVVRRLMRFDDESPSAAQASGFLWSEQMLKGDIPMDLRLSRWRYRRFPDQHSKHWLKRTEQSWESEVVRGRQDGLKLNAHQTVASMEAVKDDLDLTLASLHRTARWMQMPVEADGSLHARGLSNLGRSRTRSALIIGEALLTLGAAKRTWNGDLAPLLPSSWLPRFDSIDETLLSIALDASDFEDQAWREALSEFHDGRRLQKLWQQWMSAACRCRLTGVERTGGRDIPLAESRDECPFVGLTTAIEEFYDPREWVEQWEGQARLSEIRFFADAAPAVRTQLGTS